MNPFKDWSRFFFGPISARPLGAFRIVFGLLILDLPGVSCRWSSTTGTRAPACFRVRKPERRPAPLRFSPLHYVDNPQIRPCCFSHSRSWWPSVSRWAGTRGS